TLVPVSNNAERTSDHFSAAETLSLDRDADFFLRVDPRNEGAIGRRIVDGCSGARVDSGTGATTQAGSTAWRRYVFRSEPLLTLYPGLHRGDLAARIDRCAIVVAGGVGRSGRHDQPWRICPRRRADACAGAG